MTPATTALISALTEIDADLHKMIPYAAEHGETEVMAEMGKWKEVIQTTLTHLAAQDNHIHFLEHMRTIPHTEAAV